MQPAHQLPEVTPKVKIGVGGAMVPRGSEANPIYLTLHTYLRAPPPQGHVPFFLRGPGDPVQPHLPPARAPGQKAPRPNEALDSWPPLPLLPSQAPPWEVTFPHCTTFLLPSTRMLAGGPDGGAQWKKGQAPLKALLQQQRPGRHKGRKAQRPPLVAGERVPWGPSPQGPWKQALSLRRGSRG